jgi:HlyD family secretion protein
MRETDLRVMDQSMLTQHERIKQEEANLASARHDLTKVRVSSPIAGIVTRLNVEEGETAVVGTMNNAGTVLLTIADLSIIETEIEVDETDIPFIQIGLPAKIKIDALPDREFAGQVTEVGNSPIQTGAAAQQRATNFKVVVTIDGEVPVDAEGNIIRSPRAANGAARPRPAQTELPEGQERKEFEGAFVVEDGRAVFRPVKVGIAGERHFEVLNGLSVGDVVITGPFQSVRNLRDGDEVEAAPAPPPGTGTTTTVR